MHFQEQGLSDYAGVVEGLDFVYGKPGIQPMIHPLRNIMLDRFMNRNARVWSDTFVQRYPALDTDMLQATDGAGSGMKDEKYKPRSVVSLRELVASKYYEL